MRPASSYQEKQRRKKLRALSIWREADMLKFAYKAFTTEGREASGHIDASTDMEARRLLKAKGLKVSVLKAATGREKTLTLSGLSFFKPKIDYERLFSDL